MNKPAKSKSSLQGRTLTAKPLPFSEQVILKLQQLNGKSPPRNAITPSVDVIHNSEDVITPSKVNSLAKNSDTEVIEIGGENRGEVYKSLLPSRLNPDWPPWAMDYLESIINSRTDGEAARNVGLTYRTTYEARLRFSDLEAAWDSCRKFRDSLIVSDIEDVTLSRAAKGDPDDRMSASLGMFHLKARDDKYKDKFGGTGGINIQIVMGHPIAKVDQSKVIDAEFKG